MTPLILALVPLAMIAVGFIAGGIWLSHQPDRLSARRRGLDIVILLLGVLSLADLALFFTLPRLAPDRSFGFFLAWMMVYAIWQRRRLSHQV